MRISSNCLIGIKIIIFNSFEFIRQFYTGESVSFLNDIDTIKLKWFVPFSSLNLLNFIFVEIWSYNLRELWDQRSLDVYWILNNGSIFLFVIKSLFYLFHYKAYIIVISKFMFQLSLLKSVKRNFSCQYNR